jgi:hypothetical protein
MKEGFLHLMIVSRFSMAQGIDNVQGSEMKHSEWHFEAWILQRGVWRKAM